LVIATTFVPALLALPSRLTISTLRPLRETMTMAESGAKREKRSNSEASINETGRPAE